MKGLSRVWLILLVAGLIIAGMLIVYFATTVVERSKADSLAYGFRREYIIGCTDEGGSEQFCDCTFEYLDKNYTNEQIMQMTYEVLEDENYMPDGMWDAAVECIDYLNE